MTKRRTIVITGVCGGLGRVLLRRLMEEPDIDVVGVDKRNWVLDRPDRFRFERADLRRSHAEDVIRTARPWALVHLAFVSDQRVSQGKRHDVNVVGTSKVLGWARHHGAKRVCVLSRAAVYGARPDNPSLITEDMPLKLGAAWSESSDLVEYDHLCRSWMWEHRDVEMTVLRPVHLVGRNIREGLLHQLLRRDPVPMALGFDPMIQLVHEEDVVEAITLALTRGARPAAALADPRCAGATGAAAPAPDLGSRGPAGVHAAPIGAVLGSHRLPPVLLPRRRDPDRRGARLRAQARPEGHDRRHSRLVFDRRLISGPARPQPSVSPQLFADSSPPRRVSPGSSL